MFYAPHHKIPSFKRGSDHPRVLISADDRVAEEQEQIAVYRHWLRSVVILRNTIKILAAQGRATRHKERELYHAVNQASQYRRDLVKAKILY